MEEIDEELKNVEAGDLDEDQDEDLKDLDDLYQNYLTIKQKIYNSKSYIQFL